MAQIPRGGHFDFHTSIFSIMQGLGNSFICCFVLWLYDYLSIYQGVSRIKEGGGQKCAKRYNHCSPPRKLLKV